MSKKILFLTCFFLVQAMATSVFSDVTVPAMFSDHAVLQRRIPVPVWGAASPGDNVTVTFGDQTHTATASVGGDWW